MKLLKNADVYAPKHLGLRDILIEGDKLLKIMPAIQGYDGLEGVEVYDLNGASTVPGYIDLHIHITGGGGEQGPASRVLEIPLTQLTKNGVTTVLGLLGTDGVSRSLENLLFKCRALQEEGVTCYMLTGSYQYPSVTLTGSVINDIALIDRVVGVKIALADHRSSNITVQELIRIGSDARQGGILSGKPGFVTIHMGNGKERFGRLFAAVEQSDVPIKTYFPTHVARSREMIEDAARFTQMGGRVDLTAGNASGTFALMHEAIESFSAVPQCMTISSDAYGSQPVFDKNGVCTGMTYTSPCVLHEELKNAVHNKVFTLEEALGFLTRNPARVLGLEGVKGELREGADADIIVYDKDLSVRHVFARGKHMLKDGNPVVKGRFET
jgi:beta-aspartyl-dipeptidase (metallo-type)